MVLVRWLLFVGLTGMVGAAAVRWIVLPRACPSHRRPPADRITAGLGGISALLAWTALGVLFVAQLAAFRDPFAPLADEATLLLGTSWGRAWSTAFAAGTVAPIAFLLAWRGRGAGAAAGWAAATVLTAGLAFFPAFSGHAVASEAAALAVVSDGLHVLTAGSWLGSLGVIVLLDLRIRRAARPPGSPGEGGEGLLAPLLGAFSPVALGSAAILVGSGLYASWLHVPGPGSLIGSAYGRLLLGKVGLVLAVAALGAYHWRRSLPRLASGADDGPVRRTATLEWVLAQVVLLITAGLVGTSPPLPGGP